MFQFLNLHSKLELFLDSLSEEIDHLLLLKNHVLQAGDILHHMLQHLHLLQEGLKEFEILLPQPLHSFGQLEILFLQLLQPPGML